MIIVLRGADFSENNIGTIHLNRELDADVVRAMEHITRFPSDNTNELAQALNTLYLDLLESGLWNKVKCLSIPYYAATNAEIGFNIKTMEDVDITSTYMLDANNEARLVTTNVLTAKARGWKLEDTPSNKIALFGIISPNDRLSYNTLFMHAGTPVGVNFAGINKIQTNRTGDVLQVMENDSAVYPKGGSGAFAPSLNIPTGAFVASFNEGEFYYMTPQLNSPKVGTSQATSTKTIGQIMPFATYFPSQNDISAAYKLIGAADGLSSDETLKLYEILSNFNSLL